MARKLRRKSNKTKTVYKTVKKKRSSQRRSSSSERVIGKIIGGFGYGALRAYGSQLAQPLTSKLGFLGDYADNVVMAGASYILAKGKIPFLKNIKMTKDLGNAGLVIESAFAGADFKNQVIGNTTAITASVDTRF